jgi:exopolysaccharide production protein ExoQ
VATVGGVLRSLGGIAEHLFVFLALSGFAGSLTVLLRFGSASPADPTGLTIRQTVLLPIYLVTMGVLLTRPSAALQAAGRNLPAVLLLALALLSTSWSEAPGRSLKLSAMLTATSMFGLYLATRFPPRKLLQLLAWTLGTIAVASLMFGLLLPGQGIETDLHGDAWRGIYGNKQVLGLHMALGTVVFVFLGRRPGKLGWCAWPGAALCAGLLLLSKSRTSLLVAISVLVASPLLHLLRRRSLLSNALGIAGLAIAAGAVAVIAAHADVALAALGKEASLTGRVPLWNFVLDRIWERPWFGYGYQGFWLGWSGPSAGVSDVTGYWYPFHAHNGYLEVLLDLGIVGLLIFLSAWAKGLHGTLKAVERVTWSEDQWPVAFLIFLMLIGAGETVLLRHNTLFTVIFAAVLFAPVPNKRACSKPGDARTIGGLRRWRSRRRRGVRGLRGETEATSPSREDIGEAFGGGPS